MKTEQALQVIESSRGLLTCARIYVDEMGRPVAVVGGVACNIHTNDAPLRDGLAKCEPLDGRPDWPVGVKVRYLSGKTRVEEWRWKLTDEPRIVAAARKFADLAAASLVMPGMDL